MELELFTGVVCVFLGIRVPGIFGLYKHDPNSRPLLARRSRFLCSHSRPARTQADTHAPVPKNSCSPPFPLIPIPILGPHVFRQTPSHLFPIIYSYSHSHSWPTSIETDPRTCSQAFPLIPIPISGPHVFKQTLLHLFPNIPTHSHSHSCPTRTQADTTHLFPSISTHSYSHSTSFPFPVLPYSTRHHTPIPKHSHSLPFPPTRRFPSIPTHFHSHFTSFPFPAHTYSGTHPCTHSYSFSFPFQPIPISMYPISVLMLTIPVPLFPTYSHLFLPIPISMVIFTRRSPSTIPIRS